MPNAIPIRAHAVKMQRVKIRAPSSVAKPTPARAFRKLPLRPRRASVWRNVCGARRCCCWMCCNLKRRRTNRYRAFYAHTKNWARATVTSWRRRFMRSCAIAVCSRIWRNPVRARWGGAWFCSVRKKSWICRVCRRPLPRKNSFGCKRC